MNRPRGEQAHARPQYYCHTCRLVVDPLMAPNPTCPHCNDDFVEEIDPENDPREFESGAPVNDANDAGETDDNGYDFATQGMQHILTYIQSMLGPMNVQRREYTTPDGTAMTFMAGTGTRTGSELGANGTGDGQQQQEQQQQQPQQQQQQPPQQQQGQGRPMMMSMNFGDENINVAQLLGTLAEMISGSNNWANIFPTDPADYVWGSTGLDNIITQLMDQQSGRQAPPPASDETIGSLPKVIISKKQVAEEQLNCPVCKDDFQEGECALLLPCKHTFHEGCIKPWLKVNGTCPVCRYSLVSPDSQGGDGSDHGGGSSTNGRFNSSPNSSNGSGNSGSFNGNYNGNNGNNSSSGGSRHWIPGSYPTGQQQQQQQQLQRASERQERSTQPVDSDLVD